MNQILDAFISLGKNINKMGGKGTPENEQGVVSEKFPELKLDMENKDLIKLTSKWEDIWKKSDVKADWERKCDDNEKYWLGQQFDQLKGDKNRPVVDNAIFEALETYLPQITRRNPEAVVQLLTGEGEDPETQQIHEKFVTDIKNKLGDIADELKFRLKLKKVARHWAIYILGAAKMGWDMNKDIPTMKAVRAKKLILDPDSTIDEDGYTGDRIGEYRKMEAGTLIKTLEAIGGEQGAAEIIKKLVKEDLGTEVQFIEWWTDQYMCWTLNKDVLLKKKNPHWNYEVDIPGEPVVDEYGAETPGEVSQEQADNHFPVPKKPYIFLSVFSLGNQPVDNTSLISQNLSNQDRLNKRNRQIDKNVDSMNGGMVVSLERSGLTKDQAKGVTEALRKGGTVAIPSGSVQDAIARMSAPGLPSDVFNDRQDTRNRLSDIFGVRGSTPAGLGTEKTVRGKYQIQNLDTDRIGGGVSEYLEQFSDDVFNWIVQLLYVYDDAFIAMKAKPKIRITVKEGSLLPKDSTTLANQAIELASQGKLALVDLYKALERPNAEELAANAWLEANAPEILYANDPRIAQVIQQRAESANPEKPPSESINFKDLSPDAQVQMLAKVGIVADPEAIAAYAEHKGNAEAEKRSIAVPMPDTTEVQV